MQPRIIENLPFTDYRSQSHSEIPLFSKTTANNILSKNPKVAHYYHPKLGGNQKKRTEAMIDGSIYHALLLDGRDEIEVLSYQDWRTNEAKAMRQLVEDQGKIAILEKDKKKYKQTLEEVEFQIREVIPAFYDEKNMKEATALYEFEDVLCQSRFDWISPEIGLILDPKSTVNADPEYCKRKTIPDFGYDIQEALYTHAAQTLYPDIEWKFMFIFFEKMPPYCVSIVETDLSAKEVGYQKAYRAAQQWKACLDLGTDKKYWPDYGYNIVSCNSWDYKKYVEEM